MQYSQNLTLPEASRKLEHYCAYQERCHMEVVAKLKGMGMIPEAIDLIVGHLIREGYLNEERFARSFARGKFSIKKWGRNRIVGELKARQISVFNIRAALTEINPGEYLETLDALAEKRLGQLREPNPLKKKRKLTDYLLYRGWEPQLVQDKVRELIP